MGELEALMHRMIGVFVAAMAVLGGALTMAHEQPGGPADDRALLTALNADYVRSVLTSDTARFEQILAADFRNTGADGTLANRREFLAQIAKPSNLSSLRCEDVEIRLFGDTAIIHARTAYVMSDGRPGSGRYTDIWRKQGGRWLAVAAHVTRLVR